MSLKEVHLSDASAGCLACETNSDRIDAKVRCYPGLLATPRASGPGLTPALCPMPRVFRNHLGSEVSGRMMTSMTAVYCKYPAC